MLEEEFELLQRALDQGEEDVVDSIATDIFITPNGGAWIERIRAFETFADCKIYPGEEDSFGWLIGVIKYKDKEFTFG